MSFDFLLRFVTFEAASHLHETNEGRVLFLAWFKRKASGRRPIPFSWGGGSGTTTKKRRTHGWSSFERPVDLLAFRALSGKQRPRSRLRTPRRDGGGVGWGETCEGVVKRSRGCQKDWGAGGGGGTCQKVEGLFKSVFFFFFSPFFFGGGEVC